MSSREPCHSFRFLIEIAKKAQVKTTFKGQVIGALEYFEQQSLCDLDRRDSPQVLKIRFSEFKDLIKNIPIFEDGGVQVQDAWRAARCFCFDAEPATLLVPSIERPRPKTPAELYSRYEVSEFFSHLLREYGSFTSNAKSRGLGVSAEEEILVIYGLEFLIASTHVPKMHRKISTLISTWKKVNPILKKSGLMDPFKDVRDIEYRLQLFLKD